MAQARHWFVVGLSALCASAALGQVRNHEPYNVMAADQTHRRITLVDSVIGYVLEDDFIPFAHYGLTGVPGAALNVWRQIWVTDIANHKILRFAADINYPPEYYSECNGGTLDQIRGMEYVKSNFTVYVCHSGTTGGAPGDVILMFDITGQPIGSFPATNPMDIMYFPLLDQLLVSNGTDNTIDAYSLDGELLGRFDSTDSTINGPRQLCMDHHGLEVFAAADGDPAGIYNYEDTGEQMEFFPQAGHPSGVLALDSDIQHDLLLFTSDTGMYTYWPEGDELTLQRGDAAYSYLDKVQFFCWADYDRSDFVDTDDYDAYVHDFEAGVPQADFDGSGFVDFDDFIYFVDRFIEGC